MIYLLDTHTLIWWTSDLRRVPTPLQNVLMHPDTTVFVSAVSAMEIATKRRLGKLMFDADFMADFAKGVATLGFEPLAITVAHGALAGVIDSPHRDPFDRLLAAQARIENATLVTADPAFSGLGVKVAW